MLVWRNNMPKRARKIKTPKSQNKPRDKDYVVLTCIEDMEQSKEYEALLRANDIPAVIKKTDLEYNENKPFTIMVPESSLDEAYAVIESQYAYDDYYDLSLDEDEDDDDIELDADLLDEDGDNY